MPAIKRVYEKFDRNDGTRILIDRLWPRGVSKKEARIDLWLKDIAPSNELRKWFGHDPKKWREFQEKYLKELKVKSELVETIKDEMKKSKVTLIYAAKDTEHNNGIVLKNFLEK